MRLHKGALFYREELGTAEILVGAVVVPKALTKQIISAVHDSREYFHPGRLATEQIICQQASWTNMKADWHPQAHPELCGLQEGEDHQAHARW